MNFSKTMAVTFGSMMITFGILVLVLGGCKDKPAPTEMIVKKTDSGKLVVQKPRDTAIDIAGNSYTFSSGDHDFASARELAGNYNKVVDSLRNALLLLQNNKIKYVKSLLDTSEEESNTDTSKRPSDSIVEGINGRNRPFKIYKKVLYSESEPNNANYGYGKWEYWITSCSSDSWILITDKNYKVGQILKLVK